MRVSLKGSIRVPLRDSKGRCYYKGFAFLGLGFGV